MRPEKKELTEDEKFELQIQAEQELGRLARTYTILDRKRTQFTDTRGTLSKQKKVIDIFKREQNNILADLAVASADARKKEDERRSKDLSKLLEEYDEFRAESKMQKAHLNEIDDQIKIVQKKVLDISAKQITDDKHQQRTLKGEKTVQTLENKLEVEVKKFCSISWQNSKLREEINHLLIERSDFNKIWDRLINNLCVGKKFMLDLIEQATIAYDQREEWVSKLQILRQKAHNDLFTHIQEMRSLQRKRDNDIKLQEFFAVKGQKRIMRDLEEAEIQKRQIMKNNIEKKLQRYLNMLVTIMEFIGEDKVQNIAQSFLNQEEENFGMFKYVNFLNKEMEELTDNLGRLQRGIDEQQTLNDYRREQQGLKLENLQQQFEETVKDVSAKTEELKESDQQLQVIMNGIMNLFKMFKCKNDPLLQLLGTNNVINCHNVILYLEILEKQIEECCISVFYKEKKLLETKKIKFDQMVIQHVKRIPGIRQLEEIVHTDPCPLCVEHEQVSDVIDELQIAYTKEEIQDKLDIKRELNQLNDKLHNVSACHLPKSRQIIQKRYQ